MASGVWDLIADGFGRLEAPCFDQQGRLCFADRRPPGAVHRLEPEGTVTKLADREVVGGLVAHVDGGLVVSGRSVSVIGDNAAERVVLEPIGGWGFNDFTTNSAGDLYVGMFGEQPTGRAPQVTDSLWRITGRAEATICYTGLQLTNGLGFSPDGTRLYHNDSTPRTVWVSDVTEEGLPVNRRAFHELSAGSPDGMAVDESGCVWVAAIGAGRLVRVAPNGAQDMAIDVPQAHVASLCFGVTEGRDLYAVTFGGEPYDSERSGAIYRTRVDVAGAPVHPATI